MLPKHGLRGAKERERARIGRIFGQRGAGGRDGAQHRLGIAGAYAAVTQLRAEAALRLRATHPSARISANTLRATISASRTSGKPQ